MNPNISAAQFPGSTDRPLGVWKSGSMFWPEPLIKKFKEKTPPEEQKWRWRNDPSH